MLSFIKAKFLNNILPGFITGIVLQFNWAKSILLEKGLINCFVQHWGRIILSGIIGILLFLLIDFLLRRIYLPSKNKKRLDNYYSFLDSFNILILYFFFKPADLVLIILILFVPIFYLLKNKLVYILAKKEIKNLYWCYLCILLFLYYKEILLIIVSGNTQNYLYYFSLLTSPLTFIIIPVLYPRITKIYLIILGILFYITSFITNSHILLYKADMPPSTYYAIWETTFTESTDFIKDYASLSILLPNLILLLLFVSIIVLKIRKPYFNLNIRDRILAVVIIIVLHFLFNSFYYNIPVKFVDSYLKFRAELNKYRKEFQLRKNSPLGKQARIQCSSLDTSQIFVLIIGESASKYHQGLYGYHRNTNPLLSTIKNELFVFDSVISPHSHTNPVLAKVLTFANFEDMDALYHKRSLIEYMKDAGYKTFWLSNQQFANEHSTIASMIGIQADVTVFTNINNIDSVGSKPIYDGVLLEHYQKALNDKTPKKFIVLHLMGSHSDKAKRYPDQFKKFTDTIDIPYREFNRPWVYEIINIHDNSVLYTDFVLYQTIQMLKVKNENSIWLYFSDHGEEIFDYRDFWGHSEANSSIYMFDIPFILWLSDKFKNLHKEKATNILTYTHRKYQTDDVIHSIIDLAGCLSDDFIPNKSIFNDQFKYEKRYIYGHDYDSLVIINKKKSIID